MNNYYYLLRVGKWWHSFYHFGDKMFNDFDDAHSYMMQETGEDVEDANDDEEFEDADDVDDEENGDDKDEDE